MQKQFLTILLIALGSSCTAQTWQWATHGGGDELNHMESACTDIQGNTYIAGTFSSSTEGIFGNDSLTHVGDYSIFLAKIDSDGNFIWAKRAGGTDYSTPPFESVFNHAQVYYEGFSNSLLVASGMSGYGQELDNCILNPAGMASQRDNYLSKLNLDGECLWTVDFDEVLIETVSSDGLGNIYGLVKTKVAGSSVNGNFLSPGYHIIKLLAIDGSFLWTRKVLNLSTRPIDFEYRGGRLFISGNTNESEDLLLETVVIPVEQNDIFIGCLSSAGGVEWFRTLGGSALTDGGQFGTDEELNLYLGGMFQQSISFDDTTLNANGSIDWFLVKYDSLGVRQWVRHPESSGSVYQNRLATDQSGNSYLTGKTTGSVTFGNNVVSASSNYVGFLVKYSQDGAFVGSKIIEEIDASNNLVPLPMADATCVVAGDFIGPSDFDGIHLPSYGYDDIFVAKIDLTTSIPEYRIDGSNELFIYANPNEGKCTIDVPDDFLYENNLVLRIFDTSGKLIRQTPLVMNEGRIQLSLEQEAKGIYTATLSNNEKSYHGRIVFE